jgi:3-isopropylmalate/(R)-2-methylmalate dehydratase small subunit
MPAVAKGRAFVFGANVDTDQIYPGRYLELTDEADVGRHAMEGAAPDFVGRFRPGDIIVAGRNFGCGSSREHAVRTLKAVRAGAVLAESFARIFYRNAINIGLPVLVCPGVAAAVSDGDVLTVDAASGTVVNDTTGARLSAEPLSGFALNILSAGGIVELLRTSGAPAAR